MQLLTKEQFIAGVSHSSGMNESVKKFKDFLINEHGKSLKSGNAYLISASDFCDKKEVRLPEIKRAITEKFSKGAKQGQLNPHFDKELAKLVEIPRSHSANVAGNASYTVEKFVITVK